MGLASLIHESQEGKKGWEKIQNLQISKKLLYENGVLKLQKSKEKD